MSKYLSERHNYQFVEIADMHTRHIQNAIKKVESNKHHYYHTTHHILADLRIELLGRLQDENKELRETVKTQAGMLEGLRHQITVNMNTSRSVPGHVLTDLRDLALGLCHGVGHVTADSLRKAAEKHLGNISGHALAYVFADRRFKKIGFVRSTVPSNKGRFISVWTKAELV